MPQGLQFISEKLHSHRPWACDGIDIKNSTAQCYLSLLCDLRLRFVALRLKPFHEIERINSLAACECARAFRDGLPRKRALQQRSNASDKNGRVMRDA